MDLVKFCDRVIKYSFYALFALIPLVFSQYTSELFELNKMWLTFGLTVIIVAAWIIKMISVKKFLFRRTFFDIPILLFFLSQLISTLASLDPHISWWGYYSRFNGGLYSTICYILLYYAFLTNLSFKEMRKSVYISLLTGIIVALWGLPAHFGKDPTCLLFRGTLDTGCWTESFQPTVRIFSTLGQPAWMAAYLAFLLPIATAFFLNNKTDKDGQKNIPTTKFTFPTLSSKTSFIVWLIVALLFYIDLVFANTRAGFIAFWTGNAIFWGALLLKKVFSLKNWIRYVTIFNISLLLISFFFGFPIPGGEKFTLAGLTAKSAPITIPSSTNPTPTTVVAPQSTGSTGSGINISDSGNIRKVVWKGAIEAWQKSPIFGSGVETFAFAYYKSRPAEHNLTSEWDYLYNKAHNEYLNYLTTTGLFGLGSYLLFIIFTAYFALILLKEKGVQELENKRLCILAFGLFTGWTTILISNFFGFSVVIINLFFFLTPAFLLLIYTKIHPENKYLKPYPVFTKQYGHDAFQWTGIIIVILFALYTLLGLLNYWYADKAYALGYNLNRVGEYQQAYTKLSEAVTARPAEPVYKDELALNMATIATALSLQENNATTASQLAQQAITLSNETTQNFPNNIVFLKNRVKIFFLLNQSTLEGKEMFNNMALDALRRVVILAPTDAKVHYNLGALLKTTNTEEAIVTLERTVELKPDYTDAIRELGAVYKEQADKTTDPAEKQSLIQKARASYEKVIEQNPKDQPTKDLLNQL